MLMSISKQISSIDVKIIRFTRHLSLSANTQTTLSVMNFKYAQFIHAYAQIYYVG